MYLDLAGLSRYKRDFDAWARGALLSKDAAAARVRTAKAGAVSFVPVQETPLDVSVDFFFAETPPASGDKGPDNPSTITGVNSVKVTRCGKNLVKLPFYESTIEKYGVTFTVDNEAGTVTVNGTATQDATFYYMVNSTVKLFGGETYFLTGCPAGGSFGTYFLGGSLYNLSGDYVSSLPADVGSGASWNYQDDWTPNCIIRVKSGTTVSNLVFKPQLELGSAATSFEKYEGTDYIIPLGGTYYGGSIDLATGLMTVTHFLEQLSSSTNIVSTGFSEGQSDYRVGMYLSSSKERVPYPITSLEGYACNSFPVVADPSANSAPCFGLAGGSILTYLCLTKAVLGVGDGATYDVVRSAVLSFLGSHQVKVAGKFATPQTVQLTPTEILSLTQSSDYDPRVNTVYSDASAVQVGYLKHPSAASADLRSALVSLGGGV